MSIYYGSAGASKATRSKAAAWDCGLWALRRAPELGSRGPSTEVSGLMPSGLLVFQRGPAKSSATLPFRRVQQEGPVFAVGLCEVDSWMFRSRAGEANQTFLSAGAGPQKRGHVGSRNSSAEAEELRVVSRCCRKLPRGTGPPDNGSVLGTHASRLWNRLRASGVKINPKPFSIHPVYRNQGNNHLGCRNLSHEGLRLHIWPAGSPLSTESLIGGVRVLGLRFGKWGLFVRLATTF